MFDNINNSSETLEIKQRNKLSRENAQLHMLSENLARTLRKWLSDPNMKYFWTQTDKEALDAYDRFKEDVIWKNN
jgi:hypothetical protein